MNEEKVRRFAPIDPRRDPAVTYGVAADEVFAIIPDDSLAFVVCEPELSTYEWVCGCFARRAVSSNLCDVQSCAVHRLAIGHSYER
jgi:hypothetical protein